MENKEKENVVWWKRDCDTSSTLLGFAIGVTLTIAIWVWMTMVF